MAAGIKRLVDEWITKNVRATRYTPEADETEVRKLLPLCLQWVREQHGATGNRITDAHVDGSVGGLETYLAAALNRVNEAQVERLANHA